MDEWRRARRLFFFMTEWSSFLSKGLTFGCTALCEAFFFFSGCMEMKNTQSVVNACFCVCVCV